MTKSARLKIKGVYSRWKIILMIIKNGWTQNMLMEGLPKVSNQSNGWAQELKDKIKKKSKYIFAHLHWISFI